MDNWEVEALMNVVGEFQQNYQPVTANDGSGQQEDSAAVEVPGAEANQDDERLGALGGDPQSDGEFVDVTDDAL